LIARRARIRMQGATGAAMSEGEASMGETIILRAGDGFGTTAYKAMPSGKPKAGLVVIQEIFGVNRHMRRVADDFAKAGYVAIVPALFDRVRPNIELGYDEADIAKGRELKGASQTDAALLDIAAARDAIKGAGKLGVIGYCWGGFLAWVSATRLKGFAASVSYYGGGIGGVAQEKPNCPVQFHFGQKDHAIPMSEVEKIRAAGHKGVEVHVYPAGHGFNCEDRGSYHADSAEVALGRALAFLEAHVAGDGAAKAKPAAAKIKPAAKPVARPAAKPKRKIAKPARKTVAKKTAKTKAVKTKAVKTKAAKKPAKTKGARAARRKPAVARKRR
jgi:carboxymethylenebutenolidase